jgi:predicted PurR-regulated permease PerM
MIQDRRWQWLAATVLLGVVLFLLAPVLTPFALAALFAYLGDPVVDRLEKRFSRTTSVVIVFSAMTLAVAGILALLIPEIVRQASGFPEQLQKLAGWFNAVLTPWAQRTLDLDLSRLDIGSLLDTARAHLQDIGKILPKVFAGVGKSSAAVLGVVANLLLIPVITFYFLRDWDVLLVRLQHLLPRPLEPTITQLARESDQVLGSFLRGQLSVMVVLGTLYAVGLTAAGIQFGLLIGFIAGLLSFVPYLGPAIGIGAGVISALVSPGDPWINVALVATVFVIGQLVESFFLTPWLVGDKIGLHPVAVIFAVMAGGQLFGFFGVLLALPVAAVVMVVLRHAHQRYLASSMYGAAAPPTEVVATVSEGTVVEAVVDAAAAAPVAVPNQDTKA